MGRFFSGTSTIGPPGSIANCMANAIVVQFSDDQPSYAFKNDVVEIDDTGLIGQMSPKAFATLKSVVTNSVDYSSIQSIIQNSKAVPVREVYFSENPNSIEMVLENDQVIHISPAKRQLSIGASSLCNSFMRVGGMGGSTVSDNITVGGGSPVK
jgi:hypothetical protein